jgi:DNA-binding MarR family transcriptional regulator
MSLRRFLHRSEEVARRHGLTPQQHQLLLMIKGAPDGSERSTVSRLVESLQLTQSTVTELVQRAEEAGLLRRVPSANDGRVVHLELTETGERRIAACVAELGEERRRLVELVSGLD